MDLETCAKWILDEGFHWAAPDKNVQMTSVDTAPMSWILRRNLHILPVRDPLHLYQGNREEHLWKTVIWEDFSQRHWIPVIMWRSKLKTTGTNRQRKTFRPMNRRRDVFLTRYDEQPEAFLENICQAFLSFDQQTRTNRTLLLFFFEVAHFISLISTECDNWMCSRRYGPQTCQPSLLCWPRWYDLVLQWTWLTPTYCKDEDPGVRTEEAQTDLLLT